MLEASSAVLCTSEHALVHAQCIVSVMRVLADRTLTFLQEIAMQTHISTTFRCGMLDLVAFYCAALRIMSDTKAGSVRAGDGLMSTCACTAEVSCICSHVDERAEHSNAACCFCKFHQQAFEVVCILGDCLQEAGDDLSKALPLFTRK